MRKQRIENQCSACTREARPGKTKCESCAAGARRRMKKIHTWRKAAGLCYYCGKPPRDGKSTCQACFLRHTKQVSTFQKRRMAGLCGACGIVSHEARCQQCTEKEARRQKVYRMALRAEVLAAYGSVCTCCGEINPKFLTFDHINNDGAKQRHKGQCAAGTQFLLQLRHKNYPPDIQVLCWNCNSGRGYNGGICPHKE